MSGKRGAKGETAPEQAPPDTSRARAIPDPSKAKTVAERIDHIAAVMELGMWERFRIRELAATWAISRGRVKQHSAEASRRIAKEQTPVNKPELRRSLTDRLQTWAALNAEAGDHKSATRQVELVAKLHGLIVHQHEHQFQQEVREMLEVARQVLKPDDYRRYMAALVAKGKGGTVEQDD